MDNDPPQQFEGDPMTQQAFVWQRQWNDLVSEAVRGSAPLGLEGVVALAAEIRHGDLSPGDQRVVRVPLDFAALEAAGPVALALRMGGLDPRPYDLELVTETAAHIVQDAGRAGVQLSELQVDHDCPTRRLAECAELLQALRERIAPTPLTFTALPSWLGAEAGFQALLDASDGYVLQVHSLELPRGGPRDGHGDDPSERALQLCDPARARAAVVKAAEYGRPFRVALPTHAYVVGTDPGQPGVDAEDFVRGPLGSSHGYIVASDADAMADLVRGWVEARPPELTGLLWFRLPVTGDRFNWTTSALAQVIEGRAPARRLELEVRRPSRGLVEIDLVNRGENREVMPTRIALDLHTAPIAGDGLAGYQLLAGEAALDSRGHLQTMLPPGEKRTLAWLRFDHSEEVADSEVASSEEIGVRIDS